MAFPETGNRSTVNVELRRSCLFIEKMIRLSKKLAPQEHPIHCNRQHRRGQNSNYKWLFPETGNCSAVNVELRRSCPFIEKMIRLSKKLAPQEHPIHCNRN